MRLSTVDQPTHLARNKTAMRQPAGATVCTSCAGSHPGGTLGYFTPQPVPIWVGFKRCSPKPKMQDESSSGCGAKLRQHADVSV